MEIVLSLQNIVFHKGFVKDLQKFDLQTQGIIKTKLEKVFEFPELQNIKYLKKYGSADYRLKIGNWRVLFTQDKKSKKFVFLAVKARRDLY